MPNGEENISNAAAYLNICGVAAFHATKFAVVEIDLEHRDGLLTCALIHIHSEGELCRRKALVGARRSSIQSETEGTLRLIFA